MTDFPRGSVGVAYHYKRKIHAVPSPEEVSETTVSTTNQQGQYCIELSIASYPGGPRPASYPIGLVNVNLQRNR